MSTVLPPCLNPPNRSRVLNLEYRTGRVGVRIGESGTGSVRPGLFESGFGPNGTPYHTRLTSHVPFTLYNSGCKRNLTLPL